MYIGDDMSGMARQETNKNTVEEHLFDALMQLRLIKDRESCNFSRCGR
jgi:tRNA U38,U39,U40 pseudouridine synthase TruA